MIGIVVMDMPTHTEIELLFIHKFAVLETKSPVFEETKIINFPQRENVILHSVPLNSSRWLLKHRCHTTCKESRQCVACLANTQAQESLTRLASVCEKPPEKN